MTASRQKPLGVTDMNNQSAIVMNFEVELPAADMVEVRFVLPDGSVHHAPAHVLFQEYSDMYKEMHGIRPRWMSFTAETIGRAFENLCFEYEQHCAVEAKQQQADIASFEQSVSKMIAIGAGNRATAIKWLMDAVECANDAEYACYMYNLPYGYFNK